MWCVPFSGTVGLFNKLQTQKKTAGNGLVPTTRCATVPVCDFIGALTVLNDLLLTQFNYGLSLDQGQTLYVDLVPFNAELHLQTEHNTSHVQGSFWQGRDERVAARDVRGRLELPPPVRGRHA